MNDTNEVKKVIEARKMRKIMIVQNVRVLVLHIVSIIGYFFKFQKYGYYYSSYY
jgi:hypothetical protein